MMSLLPILVGNLTAVYIGSLATSCLQSPNRLMRTA
jgi:hypothetical protein